MPGSFTALHALTKKNLNATGDGQHRGFFYTCVGAEALLYVGEPTEIDEAGWEKLQEADEAVRQQALMALMVV